MTIISGKDVRSVSTVSGYIGFQIVFNKFFFSVVKGKDSFDEMREHRKYREENGNQAHPPEQRLMFAYIF